MKISIHQPNFLPWYPFFQKIECVDTFVILKEVQFEKNNFQNRFNFNNQWFTLSVQKGMIPIKDKKYVDPFSDWNKIKIKLREYDEILTQFDDCISEDLFTTNFKIIKKICSLLKIETNLVTDYETSLKSTDRLVDICKHFGATSYLSGIGGKKYLEIEKFGNIKVMFQENANKIHTLEYLKEVL